jgi:hypothetical protein
VVGRDLAEQGVSVGEALGELRSTTRHVVQREPTFEECEALVDAWAEATLGYLNRLSCADPLTGLDSQAHLLALLLPPSGLDVDPDLVMVVLEVSRPDDFFDLARRLSLLGDLGRGVFPRARTIARVGVRRLVVLVPAQPDLGRRVGLLVRGADGAVSLEGWRELTVTTSSVGPANVLDVGWRAPDSLLVLVADGRTTTVLAVAQDGSTVAPIGPSTTPDLVELAVAPGVPPMVRAANGDVWRYNSDFRWSLHTSGVASAFYPG